MLYYVSNKQGLWFRLSQDQAIAQLVLSVKPEDSVFTPFAYMLLTLHLSFNRLLTPKSIPLYENNLYS